MSSSHIYMLHLVHISTANDTLAAAMDVYLLPLKVCTVDKFYFIPLRQTLQSASCQPLPTRSQGAAVSSTKAAKPPEACLEPCTADGTAHPQIATSRAHIAACCHIVGRMLSSGQPQEAKPAHSRAWVIVVVSVASTSLLNLKLMLKQSQHTVHISHFSICSTTALGTERCQC